MASSLRTRFISDEPALQDRLDFSRYVAAANELVFTTPAPSTPLTIGVYGSWGSGKTTLLKLLKREFQPDDSNLWPARLREQNPEGWRAAQERAARFVSIEFSPWSYQHEPSLLVPLLLTFKEKTNARVIGEIKKIAAVTGYYLAKKMVFPVVKAATVGVVDPKAIQETGEEIERELERDAPKLELANQTKLREMVEKVVSKVRGTKGRTLVIFIDDLDRCHPPDRILDLLEQIKIFLHLAGCIFIIACDKEVVVRAIEGKFPGHGEAYLEKFIQIPFHLPDCQSPHVASLAQRAGEESEAVASDDPEWQAYMEHICSALDNNPRRFKRFYNTFVLEWNVLQHDGVARDVDRYLLAKWILLRQSSSVLSQDHVRTLELEELFPTRGRMGDLELNGEFALSTQVRLFLQKDFERRFGTIKRLSVYTRLTGRDLDITREDIEERVARAKPLPTDLSEIDLSGAYLVSGDFRGIKLVNARFSRARLNGALFDGADIQGADFQNAIFDRLSLKAVKNLETIHVDEPTLSRLHGFPEVPTVAAQQMASEMTVEDLETTTAFFKLYLSLAPSLDGSARERTQQKAIYWREVAEELSKRLAAPPAP